MVSKWYSIFKLKHYQKSSWLYDIKENDEFQEIYQDRWASQQICDFHQLAVVVNIIDFSNTNNLSYDTQLDLLLKLEKIMFLRLKFVPHRDNNYDRTTNYPNDAERSCIEKITKSLVLSQPDDATLLWRPFFELDSHYHYWIEVFLSYFFNTKYKDDEVAQFALLWENMLTHVSNANNWNKNNYEMHKLYLALLGMNAYNGFLSDNRFIFAVKRLKSFFISWANEYLCDYDNVYYYLRFCNSNIGTPLIAESIPIIAASKSSRNEQNSALLATIFCNKIWTYHRNLLDDNNGIKDAFFSILSRSIAIGCAEARDLYDKIGMEKLSHDE